MTMTVDWDFKNGEYDQEITQSLTKESQNSSWGQSYLYSMVSNHQNTGAAVV